MEAILGRVLFVVLASNIEVSGTRYSEWEAVPADKTTSINEIVEGKKFQIRTDKKIDNNYNIRWSLIGLRIEYFQFTTKWVHAAYCGGTGKVFTDEEKETKGFFRRAGVLTFLKTSTRLQIWFDDVLELTWIYDDNADKICVMRDAMEGLKFQAVYSGTHKDKVSTHYRYEIEIEICDSLDPTWRNLVTEQTFPVDTGTVLTVSCEEGFLLQEEGALSLVLREPAIPVSQLQFVQH
ncbi:hypothetical protein ACHWQZ_G015894 [Mnemiopsis leidyi]